MDKKEVNDLFNSISSIPVYIYINSQIDILLISTELLSEEEEQRKKYILFSKTAKVWDKNDVIEIVKAFNIQLVIFPNNKPLKSVYFLPNRNLKYDEALNEYIFSYGKKIIFLIKKTRSEAFLRILSKKKFIVLAKPNEKNINIDIFVTDIDGRKYIPCFGDSNFLRAFLEKNENIKDYKPYILSFSKLTSIAKHCNLDVYINPFSYNIKGKDFSLIVSIDLIKYINETVKKRFADK